MAFRITSSSGVEESPGYSTCFVLFSIRVAVFFSKLRFDQMYLLCCLLAKIACRCCFRKCVSYCNF